MDGTFVRADGCVQLGPSVTCDGFSPSSPIRIQSHVHTDHLKDFSRSKGHQRLLVCTQATYDLLCAEFNADLPRRRRQWLIMPADGRYRTAKDLDVQIALFPSGHMIGSVISATKYPDGSHFAFTSDFAWPIDSLPVRPDALVVDATYGNPVNIRDYSPRDVIGKFQELIHELRSKGSITVTGHRGRLQYALQLMADIFDGPYLVSSRVAGTLDQYMHHQGFHVRWHQLFTSEAEKALSAGPTIALIETRDRTELLSIQTDSKVYLSAFMVPHEEPIKILSNGVTRVALTDHADFPGTIELIKAIEPKCVIADSTRGGNGEALAAFVQAELGIPSTSAVRPTSPAWGMH